MADDAIPIYQGYQLPDEAQWARIDAIVRPALDSIAAAIRPVGFAPSDVGAIPSTVLVQRVVNTVDHEHGHTAAVCLLAGALWCFAERFENSAKLVDVIAEGAKAYLTETDRAPSERVN